MARFFNDFGAETLGAQPTGWTEAQDSALGQADIRSDAWGLSGRVLRLEPRNYAGDSTSIVYSLLWTSLGVLAASAGCEIAGRFKTPVYAFAGQTFAFVSGQNASNSSSYQAGISSGGTRQLRRHTAKTTSTVLASGAGGLTVNTPYGFRLRRAAAVVTFKLWVWNGAAGDFGESTATTYSATDASPLADGYVGLGFNGATPNSGDNPFSNPLHWIEFDRIGVATAGEVAPLVTHTPTAPTVTATAIALTSALITASAYSDADGDAQVARQFRIRRVSDSAILWGPVTVAAGTLTATATGLPTAKSPAEEVNSAWVAEARDSDYSGYGSWGSSSSHTTIPLWSSGRGVAHVDIQIERAASGGGSVMQSYRDFGGRDWIRSWKVDPAGVDRGIGSGQVTLFRQTGGDSLAPLVTLSDLNRVDGAFSPALDFGREVLVRACLMLPGEEPSESDWIPIFAGITDDPSWPKKVGDVMVPFRDYSGALADTFIRTETQYGDPDTPPDALVVMQAILDDWMGSGQYTIWDLTTSAGFAVTSAIYVDVSVWEALQNIAQQWGGKRVEQRWNPAAGVSGEWQLAVLDPDRAKVTPDYAIGPETYLEVEEISTRGKDLRTIVHGECVERATGKLLTSQLPLEANVATDPLVLQYGQRVLIFREASDSSPVDTQAELDDMVAAVYADVTSVPFPLEMSTKLLPFAAVDDLVTWGANAITHDEDQDGAVQTLSHEGGAPGVARTRFVCSDRPKGAVAAWLRRGVEIAGRNARPSIFSLGLTQSGTDLVVTPSVNRQGEYMEFFSRVGSSPLTAGVPDDGTSRGRIKLAEQAELRWPAKDGVHHVVGRLYAGDDQRVFAEREETITIAGVGGGGSTGSAAPTDVPGTPLVIADGMITGSTREVSAAWTNTNDDLDIEYEWILAGVPQGEVGDTPGSTSETGGPFDIGLRVAIRVRYTQGPGYEGAWVTSSAVRITEMV